LDWADKIATAEDRRNAEANPVLLKIMLSVLLSSAVDRSRPLA
jgi:hypothetical protein